ncbi:MAG: sporulation protein YqfC [Vulcanibacillus sp.]
MIRILSKFKSNFAKSIDLPVDVTLNLPRITIVGFNQIYIENYQEVVKFTEEYLLLNLKNKYLKIIGTDLKIRSIIPEDIYIEGLISQIDYLNKGDIS